MKRLFAVYGLIFIIIGLISSMSVHSGEREESLPIELTVEELLRLDEIGIGHEVTAAPSGVIRNPAEWEPSEGVIIRYPLGIPMGLVVEMSEDLVVYTIVSDYYYSTAINQYAASGVNMANVQFIIAPTNSHWTRDYGPWFIFDGYNQMGIVDHIYNRPRPDDDAIPGIIGSEWGMDVFGIDLIHTGGNYMSDGLGISMSTELVYVENTDKTESEIDLLVHDYLGNDYTVLPYIESGGIHHIDCWAKFLNPATIMIKDVDPSDPGYALLNQRAEFLSNQMSSWNRPFNIVRVYCPTGTAYTNSIILNDKVFVPLFGGEYAAADAAALELYQETMPGYEILGFYGNWYSSDAIHCRAMGVPDREMLYINHIPIFVTDNIIDDYLISAKIIDYSASGLITELTNLLYRVGESGGYLSVPLASTAVADSFAAYIPVQPYGTYIYYYLTAADNSGRIENHPYIGAAWVHRFKVDAHPYIISPDSFLVKASSQFGFYPEVEDEDDEAHQVEYADYPEWMLVRNDSLVGTTPGQNAEVNYTVEVTDGYYSDNRIIKVVVYLCGDADYDDAVNILDVVYLINYIYKDGSPPAILEAGDVNGTGTTDILDIVYLINTLYKNGPAPVCK